MAEILTAACGLDCAVCPALVAWKTNDQALRVKTAQEWGKMFSFAFTPDHINCSGCMVTEGPKVGYCSQCKIRECVGKKGIANCAACEDYPCAEVSSFHANTSEAKKRLDALRAG